MTSDTRHPGQIEEEIERERGQLKDTLEDIQDRLSVEGVARQVSDQFREHGGEISRSIARSVRQNPMALTLTGIGLAWMIFGSDRSAPRYDRDDDDEYDEYPQYSSRYRRPRRVQARPDPSVFRGQSETAARAGGTYRSQSTYQGRRYTETDDIPDWARDYDEELRSQSSDDETVTDKVSDVAARAGSTASDAGSKARSTASGAAAQVSSAAESARDSASDAWESAKSGVASAASTAKERAEALRQRLNRGTEDLSEEARRRVIAARERALEARDNAERAMRQGADRAADFYDDHPLVAGALALAAGAALAGALPRTRVENKYLGDYRDDFFAEAERIYEEEREKAGKVVSAAASEAKQAAKDAKSKLDQSAPGEKSAAEAAADEAKSAANRVADTAKSEAKKEHLGKPRT